MKKHPLKISVVLCTYNGERYLGEQIDSILRQTLQPIEIIIQDDCSTDSTWKLICDYAEKFSLIKAYRNKTNLRAHANFILAFQKASGDYIAPSDQDDIWMDNKLEKLAISIADKELAFTGEKILFEDGSEKIDRSVMMKIDRLIWGNNLKGHTFLFTKDVLWIYEYAGHFISFDYCLALYACLTREFTTIEEALSVWRRHSEVCTSAITLEHLGEKESIGSWGKTLIAIKKILTGSRSQPILDAFNDRAFFISSVCRDRRAALLAKILRNVSQQTVFSMIRAGWYNVQLLISGKEYKQFSFMTRMKSISFYFRTPFMYWYDMHLEKALE